MYPKFLTHPYHDPPFQTITDLPTHEMVRVILEIHVAHPVPLRLMRPDYFMERRWQERQMREHFVVKGGKPLRRNQHYIVLGESEFW